MKLQVNNKTLILIVFFLLAGMRISFAQFPPPPPAPAPKISETLAKNLERIADKTAIPRERREQAYAKLLEGQRYIWSMRNTRSQASIISSTRLAKQSLQKAVELDPFLAEGYTALAELALNTPPFDIDDAILLAGIAIKIDKNNFGSHQILGQLYSYKSQLNRGILDSNYTQKAVTEWKQVARLDPRNAEAFAFMSEFYAHTNQPDERIGALRSWIAAAVPTTNGFYGRIFRGERLTPESASLKLGDALIKAKQTTEAVEVLSRSVADEPDNLEAVELLGKAVESADEAGLEIAVNALQQAVYASSENAPLVVLLAQIQARTGKIDEAAKTLRDSSDRLIEKDKNSAANLQVALGDLYFGKNRFNDACNAFQTALTVRGISEAESVSEDERDFAIRVFEKLIESYKKANRPNDVKTTVERARRVLGKADLFADKI